MKDGGRPEERLLAAELHDLQIAYLSPIHFGNDLEDVASLPGLTGVTLQQILEQKIASAASADTVCSSHDLQPIFRRFFQLSRYKAFERA